MDKLGLLSYAESGAMHELERRSELCKKHGYSPEWINSVRISMDNLEQIRKMKEDARREPVEL